jgi:hypothetical protein
MQPLAAPRAFWTAWLGLLAFKAVLAWRLPLFGDEAWYWLEGQHLAAAYSDLPGLTAWLARLGVETAGHSAFGLRWPFLLLAMAVPLLLRAAAARRSGAAAGDVAGLLALGLPLLGSAGMLALPDVPLTFAATLCLVAAWRLCERVERPAVAMLGLGLALGALSHYRFALLAVAGLCGLWLEPGGRRALRDPRVWPALAAGLLAWLPLLLWNLAHGGAGWSFQFGERHPWQLHAEGLWLPLSQLLVVGPLLLALFALSLRHAWRRWRSGDGPGWGLLWMAAGLPLATYLLLGFVADRDRVSFHWPLQAWLPLLLVAPQVWAAWRPGWRCATAATSALLLLGAFGYAGLAIVPAWRAPLADGGLYPDNFTGGEDVAAWLGESPPPTGHRIVADDFMLGARLAFLLRRPDLPVLDHPLNHKHGRAAQLRLWRQSASLEAGLPTTLLMDDATIQLRRRLAHYRRRCDEAGALASPQVLSLDHGRKRFLRFEIDPSTGQAGCALPAVAWIDAPLPGAELPRGPLAVTGWAFKDGAGVARIEVTLDGRPLATARYGLAAPHVARYWQVSTDGAHPDVGFEAELDLGGIAPGAHWLGLVLHGHDGSREPWPEQRIVLQR